MNKSKKVKFIGEYEVLGYQIVFTTGGIRIKKEHDLFNPEIALAYAYAHSMSPIVSDLFLRQGKPSSDLAYQVAASRIGEIDRKFAVTFLVSRMNEFGERAKQAQDAKPKHGYIYVLRSSSGYYKIGRTSTPDIRLRTFEVKLPFEVEYEMVFPAVNMVDMEKHFHDLFAHGRVHGEWFDLDDNDLAYLRFFEEVGRES